MDVNVKLKAFKESVFKANDIRGLYPEELDHNTLELIAQGFSRLVKKWNQGKSLLIGRDVRWSSPEIKDIVKNKILGEGIDVIDAGTVTTPLFIFALAESRAQAGIMITSSHNSIRYNGLKIYKGLEPIGERNGLFEIKKIIQEELGIEVGAEGSGRGNYREENFLNRYVDFLLKRVLIKKKIKAVFDTGGGAVGVVLPKILNAINLIDATTLFLEPDPSLSKREPNPMLPEAQVKIRERIIQNKADLGFLFDPDGDRVMILDERGEIVRSDAILWLLANKFAHASEGIVYDLRASMSLTEDLAREGIGCHRSRVGYSFVSELMRHEDAVVGGELSGHFYFRDFFYSNSALFATLKILEIISSSSQKLSEIVKPYLRYFHSGEVNLIAKNKTEIISLLEKKYSDAERDYFDGATFRYPDWWFNIRPSNTEDLLRLVLETKTKSLFDEKKDEILSFILSRGAKLA